MEQAAIACSSCGTGRFAHEFLDSPDRPSKRCRGAAREMCAESNSARRSPNRADFLPEDPRPMPRSIVSPWEASMKKQGAHAGQQLALFRRGGARKGAGRKPNGERALAPRDARPRLTRHTPVLVTSKLLPGRPSLRRERTLGTLRSALVGGSDRLGFRLVEYSIQPNHLHFLVEAADELALGRGMKGLLVRVAKSLNHTWGRTGRVFGDRYHARPLGTPCEVRRALVYVLHNAKKHGGRITGVDACSSGPWFEGWRGRLPREDRVLPPAQSWLLSTGWKKGGRIALDEAPRFDPCEKAQRR